MSTRKVSKKSKHRKSSKVAKVKKPVRKSKPSKKIKLIKKSKPIKKTKKRFLKIVKRGPSKKLRLNKPKKRVKKEREYVKTGIKGFDNLFEKGIPKRARVLLAGGSGSGKTIMGLQMLVNAAKEGKKCLYMSFEESEDRLFEHMEDFGWDGLELKRKGLLMIKRFSIFDISRSLDALMAESKGELLINVKSFILPKDFSPDLIVVDSLTAIASAFAGRETYRSYIEHLFRYFENLKATTFLITETEQVPTIYSPTGVEEFLADGVIVLYNVRKGDIRESAIEILKMRGCRHVKKVVAMRVLGKIGIEVYPDQEVFGGIK